MMADKSDKPRTVEELEENLFQMQKSRDELRRNCDAMSVQNTKLEMANTELKMENDRLWRLVENLSQALNK